MAMHSTNSLLKYVVPVVILVLLFLIISPFLHHNHDAPADTIPAKPTQVDAASNDSAAESLQTLTAELSETKKEIATVAKNNETLRQQNSELLNKVNEKRDDNSSQINNDIQALKQQIQSYTQSRPSGYTINGAANVQVITTVPDLTAPIVLRAKADTLNDASSITPNNINEVDDKSKSVPFYTIPANGTSVRDKLMTALVGRIPVKGIVTDPYPFKIVISDDNLAANGLRIPHLLQMIVSGYCEGDLNLLSVRGWVTSLTFVFDDGTISTTTSNDNDIGNFTKSNSLGYLSDQYGNPFIRGKLISNAPTYLGGNIALGIGTGAANAYAQSQTTTDSSPIGGTSTTSVTGSQAKFVAGQALSGGMSQAQSWWQDREQQSFDAIYVGIVDERGCAINIAVNFAKEIHIDYNPKGRKLSYANDYETGKHYVLD